MTRTGITAACLLAGTLLVACSGENKSADSSAPATSAAAASSAASTTTTTDSTSSLPTSESTIPATPVPVMPLTGLPITDQALADRPALVVKIDNNAQARPQEGLADADIVFEEIVEFQTRFAAVFQSVDPKRVGPIRSGRTQDVDMLGSLNQPLFSWSGGNPGVTAAIDGSDLFDVGALHEGAVGYTRDRRGKSKIDVEHTLFADPVALRTMAPADHPAPPQQFQYRHDGSVPTGSAAAGVDLDMDGLAVGWRWNGTDAYLREQGGRPHQTTTGQVAAQNVIVAEVDYIPSRVDAHSPEAQTIGSGKVLVYTAGTVIEGTWTRTDRLQPFVLTDSAGAPILLSPGRTWVELAKPGTSTTIA